jgi:2'-5' RNA ligase superfamily
MPGSVVRQHLTVLFAEREVPELARFRRQWDPVMALRIPPHLTVVYPEEVSDFDLLLDRARRMIPLVQTFHMRLGAAIASNGGTRGVFVEAIDESGSLTSLREELLADPFEPADIRAHVTVVHPRTSARGPECWQQLNGWSANAEVEVSQIAFTLTSTTTGMQVVETFQLR